MKSRRTWSLAAGVAAATVIVAVSAAGVRTVRTEGPPDLSGVWRAVNAKYIADLSAAGKPSPLQPWGATLLKQHQSMPVAERPFERCMPRGVPGMMLSRDYPWKIVQAPNVIAILFDEGLHHRQIHLDGRPLPEILVPSWMGYTVGKWDGDSLVAETIGFNEETWLDDSGRPHSSAMHLTERFRRPKPDRLEITLTVDDAKTYVSPWSVILRFERVPEQTFAEHVCTPS
jgi:hypothetical protein